MRRRAALLTIPALVVACGPSPSASTELMIYAAASLHDALTQVRSVYEAANPGIHLVVTTDSSAALRTKIEEGAPADVFLSADTKNPEQLIADELAIGPATAYAGNSLALVVPPDNPGIETPADLATDGVAIVAAGEEVPITRYAEDMIAALAALPDYPPGFAEAYAANVVSREDNVSGVLTKVELGEADAGFVYRTDALAGRVVSIPIPDVANTHAVYAGVVIAGAAHAEAAASFLKWLAGKDGQALLAGHGFVPPD